mmetsp:Transcript_20812/g.52825  ORF Transcript_20812/g.52825 Transcript_20812/m.52825 type:complete len:278 (-) Transcript_20812:580-1413(-)
MQAGSREEAALKKGLPTREAVAPKIPVLAKSDNSSGGDRLASSAARLGKNRQGDERADHAKGHPDRRVLRQGGVRAGVVLGLELDLGRAEGPDLVRPVPGLLPNANRLDHARLHLDVGLRVCGAVVVHDVPGVHLAMLGAALAHALLPVVTPRVLDVLLFYAGASDGTAVPKASQAGLVDDRGKVKGFCGDHVALGRDVSRDRRPEGIEGVQERILVLRHILGHGQNAVIRKKKREITNRLRQNAAEKIELHEQIPEGLQVADRSGQRAGEIVLADH